MLQYADLHNHTAYSLYDGFQAPKAHVKRAKKLGHVGYAITDHGNVSGWVETMLAGKEVGLPVVLGVEAYFQPTFDTDKERYHMTMLALDKTGYENISQLMSEGARTCANVNYPIFTLDMLKKRSEGIIVLSGCIGGYIPRMINQKRMKAAHAAIDFFQQLYGNRFYAELMPFPVIEDGQDIQYRANSDLLNLAHKYNIKPVLTCDAHYVSPEQYDTYEKMWDLKKGNQKMIADYSNLYMHSADEMAQAFADQMGFDGSQYIEETARIVERSTTSLDFGNMLPRLDWGMKSSTKLAEVAKQGLMEKGLWKEEYLTQMRYEIGVIKKLGFEDYFLMCYEMVNWAREQDIKVGYGRGSVCGSLLAYAINLTQVDPIRLGTSFDRFLHPFKMQIPDIDTDFQASRRAEVIAHIEEIYAGRCISISTVGYYDVKGLVNDLCRAMGEGYMLKEDSEELKEKLILIDYSENKLSLKELKQHARAGVFFHEFDQKYPTFLEHFCLLNGQASYRGHHPAGIAITPGPIEKIVPIMAVVDKKKKEDDEVEETEDDFEMVEVIGKNGKKRLAKKKKKKPPIMVSAYDMKALDSAGVLKLDILGLKTYDVLADIEAMTGCSFSYDILDDPKIYEGFSNLDTNGIFQFGSPTMKRLLIRVKPRNFDEVVACNTLVRPGSALDDFLAGKRGKGRKNSPTYKYCQDTYGALIYEEQKLAIALGLAKFDRLDGDKLVKQAKKGVVTDEMKKKFIDGAVQYGGITAEEASKIIEKMALYSFNKGHCVAYSLLAVYTMWLKIYYPLEFYTCLLRHEKDKNNRALFEQEAVKKGQIVLLPSVNGSVNYRITYLGGEACIQRGLTTVNRVGLKCANVIERSRGNGIYLSLEDMLTKVREKAKTTRSVHTGIQKELEDAGALIFDEEEHFELSARVSSLLLENAYKLKEEKTWVKS